MATDTFLLDWSANVKVSTSWETDLVSAANSNTEERSQLLSKPYRTFSVRWFGLTGDEAARLHMLLAAAMDREIQLPLYCDQAHTTASSSGTTINCPTADRRFQVGKNVVILARDGEGRATNVQTREITVVGANSLTVTPALTGSYDVNSIVYPLVLVEALLEARIQQHTSRVAVVEASFTEEYRDPNTAIQTPLEPFHADVQDPSGFPTYRSFPVFDMNPDWRDGVKIGLARKGTRYNAGRGRAIELLGSRPAFVLTLPMLQLTREEVFAILRFHDSRRGRLMPFWVPHPGGIWRATNFNTAYVDIRSHGDAADLEQFYQFMAVVMKDGTVHIREIDSVTDNSGTTGTFRLTVDTALPAISAADVHRVCPAFFCRFQSDGIDETWLTDEVCRIELNMVELVYSDEKEVVVE